MATFLAKTDVLVWWQICGQTPALCWPIFFKAVGVRAAALPLGQQFHGEPCVFQSICI